MGCVVSGPGRVELQTTDVNHRNELETTDLKSFAAWRGKAAPERKPDGQDGKPASFLKVGAWTWREYVEWTVFNFEEVRCGGVGDDEFVELLDNTSGRGDVHVRLTKNHCEVMANFTNQKYVRYYCGKFLHKDTSITTPQLLAIDRNEQKGCEASRKLRNDLRQRLAALKVGGRSALHDLEDWIADEAPVLFHVKFDKVLRDGRLLVDAMLEDDYYRNIFEVGDGGGCKDLDARAKWEVRMFGEDAYGGASCRHADRPKYGCLNMSGDPDGVPCATWYGSSYLVLKDRARWRCTMTSRDSSLGNAIPGSLRQCSAVLMDLSDDELLAASRHASVPGSENVFSHYREVQVHGTVKFSRDIARLVADAAVLSGEVRGKVEKFAVRHGIPLEWRHMGLRCNKMPENA